MSAKSVVGEVYWRMYWLGISLRGDSVSSRAFTGASCDAKEGSASDSTVTSSETEASFRDSESSVAFPAVTVTCRSKTANPAAEAWTEYVPADSPDIVN